VEQKKRETGFYGQILISSLDKKMISDFLTRRKKEKGLNLLEEN